MACLIFEILLGEIINFIKTCPLWHEFEIFVHLLWVDELQHVMYLLQEHCSHVRVLNYLDCVIFTMFINSLCKR
jgi:hypothetical protein